MPDPKPDAEDGGGRSRLSRLRDPRLLAPVVTAALLVWFALANLRKVTITFWVVSGRVSLITVIVISGVLGAGVTHLAGRSRRSRHPGSKG